VPIGREEGVLRLQIPTINGYEIFGTEIRHTRVIRGVER